MQICIFWNSWISVTARRHLMPHSVIMAAATPTNELCNTVLNWPREELRAWESKPWEAQYNIIFVFDGKFCQCFNANAWHSYCIHTLKLPRTQHLPSEIGIINNDNVRANVVKDAHRRQEIGGRMRESACTKSELASWVMHECEWAAGKRGPVW